MSTTTVPAVQTAGGALHSADGSRWARLRRVPQPAILAVLLLGGLVTGLVTTDDNLLYQGTVFLTYCLVVVGLTFAMSTAGEFFLGAGAVFAISAYAAALCTSQQGWNFVVAVAVGAGVGLAAGLLVGMAALRVSGWYFGLATYFLVAILPDLLNIFSGLTGGDAGLFPIPDPELGSIVFDSRGRFLAALVMVALALVAVANLRSSPHGSLMAVMRDRKLAAAGAGISPLRLRVIAYAACSLPAAVGGTVFGHTLGFLSPGQFPVSQSVLFFSAVILGGGARSSIGPLLALAILYFIPQALLDASTTGQYVVGAAIVVAAIVRRQDLAGALRRVVRLAQTRGGSAEPPPLVSVSGVLHGTDVERLVDLLSAMRREDAVRAPLIVSQIQVRFGEVYALDFGAERLRLEPGTVHTVLGPNGSGKTTLLNVVCGFVAQREGSVSLGDDDLKGRSPAQRARAGISRSWQTAVLPLELTPRELIRDRLALHRRLSVGSWVLRLPAARRARRESDAAARELLEAAGLSAVADMASGALDSTARRILDVLVACANGGSFVLLDEPAAGLSKDERRILGALITGLAKAGVGVVLVEHDLDLAIGLADTVTVLERGVPIFSGLPADARTDVRVSEAFLGAAR